VEEVGVEALELEDGNSWGEQGVRSTFQKTNAIGGCDWGEGPRARGKHHLGGIGVKSGGGRRGNLDHTGKGVSDSWVRLLSAPFEHQRVLNLKGREFQRR